MNACIFTYIFKGKFFEEESLNTFFNIVLNVQNDLNNKKKFNVQENQKMKDIKNTKKENEKTREIKAKVHVSMANIFNK
ncbi:MAG: hypothetical protein GF308_03445 [Candidatus Heimdallarchaeota archaeon]|nr:hypothetical protein [Candidatus Heimdallarchaeota archaeon]